MMLNASGQPSCALRNSHTPPRLLSFSATFCKLLPLPTRLPANCNTCLSPSPLFCPMFLFYTPFCYTPMCSNFPLPFSIYDQLQPCKCFPYYATPFHYFQLLFRPCGPNISSMPLHTPACLVKTLLSTLLYLLLVLHLPYNITSYFLYFLLVSVLPLHRVYLFLSAVWALAHL